MIGHAAEMQKTEKGLRSFRHGRQTGNVLVGPALVEYLSTKRFSASEMNLAVMPNPLATLGQRAKTSEYLLVETGTQVDADLPHRVKRTMVETLDLSIEPESIAEDTPLYASVIRLDSLGLLHLMVALENEFGCQIDDEDVMEADLTTVASVIELVRGKVSAGRPVDAA
jgi:acyl carrier protein